MAIMVPGTASQLDPAGLRVLFRDVLRVISLALDLDESVKLDHAGRVAYLAYRVGCSLGLDGAVVYYAGLLHDIGGIGLSDHTVHHARASFSSPEARGHSERGVHIIRPFSVLRALEPAILHHHERFDGRGFPAGRATDEIPLEAAAVRIADQLEIALRRSHRSRRAARAMRLINRERGTGVAPRVADAALDLLDQEPDLLERLYDPESLARDLDALCPVLPWLASTSRTTLLSQLLWVLARVVDTKHAYTMGHSARVAHAGFRIAREFGEGVNAWDVAWAGLLHDVGKIGVPRRLLDKPGRLSDSEWRIVQRHASDSQRIISTIRDLAHLAYPAAAHHERYEGGGYPAGAAGEAIPLIGRILAYADVFDALTTTRSYRPALSTRDALTHIRSIVGTALDPHLGKVALDALEALAAPGADLPSFENFYEHDDADLDTGFGPEPGSSPTLRTGRAGAVLLGLEPWVRVTLGDGARIVDGGARLRDIVGCDVQWFGDWLDAESARDLDAALARLEPGATFTRYLFSRIGAPFEVVLLRDASRVVALCRSARNRLESMDRLALYYRNFLRSSVAVVLTDPEARIIDVNGAFLDLFGYQLKDVIGQHTRILRSGHQDHEFYRRMWAAITDPANGSWSGELVDRTRDGHEIHVRLTIQSVRDSSGGCVGYVGHVVDISDRVRAERELRLREAELREKNDELLRVSRFKDDLLAMTSHDIRGPLASIANLAALCGSGAPELPPDRLVGYLGRIRETATDLLEFVNDLLDLDKTESGTFRLQLSRVRLDWVLAEVAREADCRNTKGVRVAVELDPAAAPCVADPARMAQVFANLLSNAIKFTPAGSTVTARYRELDDRVVVDVDDAGPGIPDEALDAIFDRYFQVKQKGAVPKRGFGTGLGLNIVRNLLTLHGGKVSASNLPEGGCRFTVELPADRSHPLLSRLVAVVRASHGRLGEQLLEQLSEADVQVVAAESSGQARRLIAATLPDLLFVEDALLDRSVEEAMRDAAAATGLPLVVRLVDDLRPDDAGGLPGARTSSLPLLPAELSELLQEVRQLRRSAEEGNR